MQMRPNAGHEGNFGSWHADHMPKSIGAALAAQGGPTPSLRHFYFVFPF